MTNVSDRRFRENQNTFYVQYFLSENHAVHEIIWKNMVELGARQGKDDDMIWCMRFACRISRATPTYTHIQNM
jgi:hypothetical protein